MFTVDLPQVDWALALALEVTWWDGSSLQFWRTAQRHWQASHDDMERLIDHHL